MTDMKVLIVDDEEYAREGLVNSIPWTEYGFSELMQARNGEEALQICQWFHPDLVLTDIQMPKLTGVEFAHKLAEICPESKLIFITAYMEIRYLREAITLSAVDFLEKPISVAAVNKAVKKAVASLQKQRGQRSSDRKRKELESEKLAQTLKWIGLKVLEQGFHGGKIMN